MVPVQTKWYHLPNRSISIVLTDKRIIKTNKQTNSLWYISGFKTTKISSLVLGKPQISYSEYVIKDLSNTIMQ